MNKLNRPIFFFRQFMGHRMSAATIVLLTSLGQLFGQPTIVSTVPPKGATGISSISSVVFTFSTSMNTNRTTVTFYTSTSFYTMSNFWNATSNVLTCSPVTAYMVPAQVVWTVSGTDSSGNRLQGMKVGDFFTSANDASGTNAYTTFVIGRADLYTQAVNGQPTPYLVEPYTYLATTSLASNRTTTTGITLTLPSGGVSNLVQDISQPEHWVFGGYMTNEAILETNFPPGNYTFIINATTSNETKVVAFPSSLVQPNAPQLVNLAAAQAIDSTLPFTLNWAPFVGGTATDFIQAGLTTSWQSPNIGTTNALDGTATYVTIPAGILAPGQTYSASVGFSHYSLATNGTEATYVYRSTITQFSITTKPATVTVTPVITNGVWSGGVFGFDLLTASGQTVTVVSSTNAASPVATWPIFETITNPGTTIHISDPRSGASPALFYRVRSGN